MIDDYPRDIVYFNTAGDYMVIDKQGQDVTNLSEQYFVILTPIINKVMEEKKQ